MQEKNLDTFELSKKTSRNTQSSSNFENFFMNENKITNTINFTNINYAKRLNDYDLNLLEEDAYKDVEDDIFKLEYKIHKLEEELKNINSQLQVAIEINDYIKIKELASRKEFAESNYKELIAEYNTRSISTKITSKLSNYISNPIKARFNFINNLLTSFIKKISLKLPQKYLSIFELKNSLNKLENINKNVDELMTLNNSYSNDVNKYDRLSKYIIKANSIQAQINNSIRKK